MIPALHPRSELSPNRFDSSTHRGPRFDLAVTALSVWLVSGLFLDGWAHHHLAELETFFTPWHAVFYSGFLALAALLVITALLARLRHGAGAQLLPDGYEFALVGILAFVLGGIGDFAWHTFFGVEADVEALLSPTHLLLVFGIGAMVSGPVRAAWRRPRQEPRESWAVSLPAIVAYSALLSLVTFFTQFANPFVQSWAFGQIEVDVVSPSLVQETGITSLIVTAILITGAVILAARRARWPFGAMTVILGLNALGMSVFSDEYRLIPAGLIAGLAADFLVRRVGAEHPRALVLVAAVVPAAYVASLHGILWLTGGLAWSIHLWAGSIVMVAAVGWLLALVTTAGAGVSQAGPVRPPRS